MQSGMNGVGVFDDGRNEMEVPSHIRFLRGFVEGNYFYVFSALMMMLGTCLAMSSSWIQGAAFKRTLESLLILQGYEALIVATSLAIVARFRKLGDAFTLFAIELALLLDPTFFSNAFATIPNAETPPFDVRWVNAGCLLFMIAKLGILQQFLHIRIAPRALAGFAAAGVFVYMAEGPLNREAGPVSRQAFYYLLAWAPFLLTALFPTAGEAAVVRSPREGFATPRQTVWLPRLVYVLPLAIVVAHFFESSYVYGIRFYWTYGAPLLLALGLATAKHWRRSDPGTGMVLIDVMCGLALLISFPGLAVEGKEAFCGTSVAAPWFLRTILPAAACGAAAALLYGYFAWKHGYRPALYRIVAMAAALAIYGIVKSGVLGFAGNLAIGLLHGTVRFIAAHPRLIAGCLWVALGAVAIRFPRYGTWLLFGLYSILFLATWLPDGLGRWMPEAIQAALILGLALSHVFGGPGDRPERTAAALILAAIGFLRFWIHPSALAAGIVAAESLGLIAAGYFLRQGGYAVVGMLQGLLLSGYWGRRVSIHVAPAAGVLGAGLALFVIGVFVTFRKEQILGWFARWVESTRIRTAAAGAAMATGLGTGAPVDARHGVSATSGTTGDWSATGAGTHPTEPLEGNGAPGLAAAISPSPGPANSAPPTPPPASTLPPPPLAPTLPPSPDEPASDSPWKEESAMESKSTPVASGRDPARLLCHIFLTDIRTGVYLAEDLDPRNITEATSDVEWLPREALVVCFSRMEESARPWPIALTSRRVLYRPPDRRGVVSVYYPQIAFLSRQLGTVLFSGHAGQVLMCHGLTVPQATILKRGLETFLSETAMEGPAE